MKNIPPMPYLLYTLNVIYSYDIEIFYHVEYVKWDNLITVFMK